jgi:nucleotide-binding universal stress UspA family protein
MYRFKRVFVGLDFSAKDTALISYAGLISRMAQSEEVIFFHVKKQEPLAKDLQDAFPELAGKSVDELQQEMQDRVGGLFAGHERTRVRCEVREGLVVHEMLHCIKDSDIDLSIVGQQADIELTSKVGEKLTRKAPCSVLILPEHSRAVISSILTAIEYSDNCAMAVDTAVAIASAANLEGFTCAHVFKLPLGYQKTGKTKEQFQEIMKRNSQKAFDEFIAGIDLRGLQVRPVFYHHKNTIQGIQELIEQEAADLVVLAAQGRTTGASILLGSVTEGVIRKAAIPILAVKKKGANLNILESILKL